MMDNVNIIISQSNTRASDAGVEGPQDVRVAQGRVVDHVGFSG